MQGPNALFDDMARMMTNAAGVAQGVQEEARSFFRSQLERLLAEMDLVTREEFEAVRAMAQQAREENESLRALIQSLSERLDKEQS